MAKRRITNPAWRRLIHAFRLRVSRSQVVAGVLLALLGFAATAQMRTLDVQDDYGAATRPELIQILDGLNQRAQRMENEINDLRQVHDELRSGADQSRTAIEQAEERARTLGVLAGTEQASGPGVTIIIADSAGAVNASLVLNAIQELRDAGAEAIEINDEVRVVANSYVVDAQGGINLDDTVLTPPYTIEAIGDPRTLREAMHIPGGVVDEVEGRDGVVTITEHEVVAVETLYRPSSPEFATPAPADEDDGEE